MLLHTKQYKARRLQGHGAFEEILGPARQSFGKKENWRCLKVSTPAGSCR